MNQYWGFFRSARILILCSLSLPALAQVTDADNDGLPDTDETSIHGTNPLSWDSDADNISDGYEILNSLNPVINDANLDADTDGFNNLFEYRAATLSNDAGSVPPAVNAYTEDFASLSGGDLPSGWFIPGSALSVEGVTLQPTFADSSWYTQLANTQFPSLTGGAALRWTCGQGTGKIDHLELQLNLANNSVLVINTTSPGGTAGYGLRVDDYLVFADFLIDSVKFYSRGNTARVQRAYLTAGPHTVRFSRPASSSYCDILIDTLSLTVDSGIDTDNDGLADLAESYTYQTDPADPDTDNDGLTDGDEVNVHGTNPTDADSDDDTLTDAAEVLVHGTNPKLRDTDGDGLNDSVEIAYGLDPLNSADVISVTDWDGDRYPNVIESIYGTSIRNAADHPLPPPYVDNLLESFEAPFDSAVWNLGQWRTTFDAAAHGVRSLRAYGGTESVAKLTVNARAGASLHFRYRVEINNNPLRVKINNQTRLNVCCNATTWNTAVVALDTGVNVIEFGAFIARIDDIRFALTDSDADGMADAWETENGYNPASAADMSLDSDNDGFTTLDESLSGTKPDNADTDGDGIADGAERSAGLNPLRSDVGADSDGDGLLDSVEVLTNLTEPYIADTDYDGIGDGLELAAGLDPLSRSAVPERTDTDSDRYPNVIEALYGSDWANAASKPPTALFADGQLLSFETPFDALPWTLGSGSVAWTVTDSTAVDGSRSLRSHAGSTTSVVYLVNARIATQMHFRFRTDDMVNRKVQVRLNNENPINVGTNDTGLWKYTNALILPAGVNRIEFIYTGRADNKAPVGCDCVYIDAIQFYHYPDYDQDGISNAWEIENGLSDNDAADAGLDTDNDGLTGMAEYRAGTSPNAWDSDGDTLADGADAGAGLNPLQNDLEVDSDGDGVSNATEVRNATDPHSAASKPEPLGTYFESFEAASPPFWFSPGGTGPEDLDWAWTPLTATDGQASIVGTTGPLQTNRSPNVSLLVTTDDSFLSFDYSALNNALYPGCGASDCTVDAQFSVVVDDEPMYVVNPTGAIDWTPVGGVFLPAGEHLIEFGLTSPACVGTACSNALPDDVAQTWIDSLLIKPADPEDETDSDGDGVSDYDEVYQYHTDPMFPDIVCEDPANPPDGKLFNDDCETGCHP